MNGQHCFCGETGSVNNGPSSQFFDSHNWKLTASHLAQTENADALAEIKCSDNQITFLNRASSKARFLFQHDLCSPDDAKGVLLSVSGSIAMGTGSLFLNGYPIPLNGKTFIPVDPDSNIDLIFECSAFSEVEISSLSLVWENTFVDLSVDCSPVPSVLVVVPDYPMEANLYLAAFAHSRNRRYIAAGLDIQVAVIKEASSVQSIYEFDEVPVFVGNAFSLKRLIQRKQYSVIVVHFVELIHYKIFDSFVTNERLIFICHGPETTLPILWNLIRPYFSKPVLNPPTDTEMANAIKAYSTKDNVEWVFVSDWLANESEKVSEAKFKNVHIIHNIVDEDLFPYKEKSESDRARILMLRRFEDNQIHSVDIAIETILALSRRPIFQNLSFDIVGDGSMFETLTEPVRHFENVNIRNSFIPNSEISEIHGEHGILLAPSRHDSQGVTSCEAASSGLVVVASNVTCAGYFFDGDVNNTLADPENPEEMADIIERLYCNPGEFKVISKRMSDRIRRLCSAAQTTDREIDLIKTSLEETEINFNKIPNVHPDTDTVLTIAVPVQCSTSDISRCLNSLLAPKNAGKLEVILLADSNDGGMIELLQSYKNASPGTVRILETSDNNFSSLTNRALKEARGEYFRLINGSDWVVPSNLDAFIEKLENESADLILTLGKFEHISNEAPTEIIEYPMLQENRVYYFDDLTYPAYGFKTNGAILPTSTYKTSKLRKSGMELSSFETYFSAEYDAYAIKDIDTVRFYDLDVYRKTADNGAREPHANMIRDMNSHKGNALIGILDKVLSSDEFSPFKKEYVVRHVIAPNVNQLLVDYDGLKQWEEIGRLFEGLEKYPGVAKSCREYIVENDPSAVPILKYYKKRITENDPSKRSLYGIKKSAKKNKVEQHAQNISSRHKKRVRSRLKTILRKISINNLVKCFENPNKINSDKTK